MALKNRITLIVLVAILMLCAAFGAASWLRDKRQQARYDAVLLQSQTIAWDRLQKESLDLADATARRLLEDPSWPAVWAQRDRSALGARLDAAVAGAAGLRVDVFDALGALVASTDNSLDPAPLARAGWVVAAAGSAGSVQGLSQVDAQHYAWVSVRGFDGGAIAVGWDARARLAGLASGLGGEAALLNMRGREVVSTQPGRLQQQGIAVPVRTAAVSLQQSHDFVWQVVSRPLQNPDGRVIGALVWLRDVTSVARADRRADLFLAGAAVLLVAALVGGLLMYLRHAMEPLSRSVGVLQALAGGATDAALDEGEDEAEDESGDIARGIVAIRTELLNLQTLREERVRTRRQQERLIRDQLRTLADSLDSNARLEILAALGETQDADADPAGSQASAGADGSPNQLAELAGILGRMSGLVTNQQNQLLKLLRDLQAAMETQAMFASLQQELEIARQMQLSILPRSAPDAPGVEVRATMVPAKEIGGDFYDYFMVDHEHLAVVVADVSGKGVPAAFFMAISRTLLKSHALFLRRPGAAIEALNNQLCAENEQMMFVTVFFSLLHLPTGRLTYVNAGHNPPVRIAGHEARYFPSGQNMALAVLEDQTFTEGETMLAVGETIVFYTDGVTEATNAAGDLLGEAALLALLGRSGAGHTGLPQQVLQAVHAFEDGVPQSDDVTVVSLTYKGTP
ncbi:PP2C family protein-serine/threonine phosphatase [Xylophilus sp. Leaf220]|uniref:PP2C family protein-serine/threonine phosphatase n=1 Tax=Xylophilus sp. Leaf220 TaxID=1735686 RepID=UPI0006F6D91E|nr:PP2C family protein-serine/threonine phosphatase [Xylophilus sp. Leaf220]KQM78943.1 hypothetical protein ASE76_16270 [Xylophilus sp. Leaf220]